MYETGVSFEIGLVRCCCCEKLGYDNNLSKYHKKMIPCGEGFENFECEDCYNKLEKFNKKIKT